MPEKPFQNSLHDNLVQKNTSGEPYLVVNHSKKIVHSGKSTIIYLRHDADEKDRKPSNKKFLSRYEQCLNEEEHSRKGVEGIGKRKETEDVRKVQLCKSENDLCPIKKEQGTVKQRSRLTSTLLNRYNTFISGTSSESKYDSSMNRNICVPNHIPVKMYVNNIEVNKKLF